MAAYSCYFSAVTSSYCNCCNAAKLACLYVPLQKETLFFFQNKCFLYYFFSKKVKKDYDKSFNFEKKVFQKKKNSVEGRINWRFSFIDQNFKTFSRLGIFLRKMALFLVTYNEKLLATLAEKSICSNFAGPNASYKPVFD